MSRARRPFFVLAHFHPSPSGHTSDRRASSGVAAVRCRDGIVEASTRSVKPIDPTEHTPVTAAARAHQVVDADVGRLAQIRHRLLQRADVELKATRDADMAEEASGVVEDKAENPVLGARGTSSVQARHASDVTAQSASAKKFRQGSCPPDGVEHGVHPGKREAELEGKTDGTELTIGVLTEERHEIVDIALHRKSSASPSLRSSTLIRA